ncbi:hypothetical protein ACJRO7_011450 [Eucalyptus globulus]|uniref:DUF7903 domain-containing protein n=1 Tax=Eucalyptus globulus TaxID=34317 RepID=A0ABD3LG27_EUCGL
MAYVPRHKQLWKERDGSSCAPASVAWRSPETTAHQNGQNHRHWTERDGPSCVPPSVAWRSPETIAHQIGRSQQWKESNGPSRVPPSVARRSPESIAHQIGRNQHWKERDGASSVPPSVVWRVREGPNSRPPEIIAQQNQIGRNQHWQDLNSRSTETIAHQIGRNQHWKESDGLSHVPPSVVWRVREGPNLRSPEIIAHQNQMGRNQHWQDLDSRLPETIAHQNGRNQHWQERDDLSRFPASIEGRFRKDLNLRSPETSAHQIGKNRHWKERDGPSCVPASFRKDLNLKPPPPKPISHQSGRIEYAGKAISRWLAVGLDDYGYHLPPGIFLRPVSVEAIELEPEEKPLVLAKSSMVNEDDERGRDHRKEPWVHIAETMMQYLVCSFKALRSEIKDQNLDGIKPTMIARFGKIIFRGSTSFPVETRGHMVTKASLKWLKRIFYTNLPSSYLENLTHKVIPEIGLSFKDEKDIYLVKLCDLSRPGVTICCKCRVIEAEQRLEPYKVELGQRRHVVVDVSCLNKDLDMRLMLRAKRLFTAISEDEKNSIWDMVSSAVLDSSVKGGLRWPLRKAFSGDRYRVVGAWHTISRNYNNSSMRLKVKHADRFDFRSSHGQVTEEITLKLNGLTSELHGQNLGADSFCDMLKDAVKIMWEHFLYCGSAVV